ncbi:zinc-binding alcohol dehydrogenase family protein [Trinickia caryophylli]|uniref:2-desacetyl-2-hydroxyethyl bacteriochlorophyllide A dehydrogenase n=1 Tax=Trinickia caryophylli TaxID=28094 RepID=A0A1X7DNY1_TRICW|nr:zinc-binding alcohol dehydrogenase family protein [Trinickia caryophylli]PMS10616.1 dehydrogenase [Trinickia caryophylli]TRX17207.1 zinc-binding alcohol dehydrogenase family protein [Trinickia caryophylli]WQE12059.1 zinc-binding alcohol dehydrogenase family protein [Trinickia caryophylli]SMF18785.1 2-desacetyl-2-hydroxyethyl bacteriochlorophyllide A dehydrogenase [Trinickia caryophylli]GLU31818.1 alcohol dehydrogenase [Trinickia caryophylli]
MKTVICEQPGKLALAERPIPETGPDDVLLRIKRVGVCGTDLHIFTGNQPYLAYPRVMGHELAGIVESAPAGARVAAGDQVYVMPYISCGHCVACRAGKTNCCVNIQVLGVHADGGMTEYLAVPQAFVFKADGVTLDQAAMLEFLAIGAHAVARADVAAAQRALVVGAGPIGMAAALFAKLRGAQVCVLDSRADRLAVCAQALGADHTVVLDTSGAAADARRLAELTGNEFFDVVFDATGNIKAMERGLDFVAHGGKYVLISIVRDRLSFSDPEFHKRETTLLASRNATPADFETVLEAMRAGRVPTDALNTHRLALAELPDEFPKLLDPNAGVIKALVAC